jgi:hypothetical protein
MQGIGDHWKVRAKGTNLLLSPQRERTGDVISQQVDADWSVSLGVVWTPL